MEPLYFIFLKFGHITLNQTTLFLVVGMIIVGSLYSIHLRCGYIVLHQTTLILVLGIIIVGSLYIFLSESLYTTLHQTTFVLGTFRGTPKLHIFILKWTDKWANYLFSVLRNFPRNTQASYIHCKVNKHNFLLKPKGNNSYFFSVKRNFVRAFGNITSFEANEYEFLWGFWTVSAIFEWRRKIKMFPFLKKFFLGILIHCV